MVSTTLGGRQWDPVEQVTGAVLAPNLHDYDLQSREFSWERLREELVDRADEGMNIARMAIDRPAATMPDKLAARFVDSTLASIDLTYGALLRATNKFANLLRAQGVQRGDVVASLLGRCPELFMTVLDTLKSGAVFSPLFSAFGPEPIRSRLDLSGAVVLVTTQRLYERKVAAIRKELPLLRHVFLIPDNATAPLPSGTVDIATALAGQPEGFDTVTMDPDRKTLPIIMNELRDLTTRVRAGHMRAMELAASTITVTSLAEEGVDLVVPAIYPPQVAIVGFGSILERPWVVDNAVQPMPVVTITVAADHRVTDGRAGARFLAHIRDALQAPEKL